MGSAVLIDNDILKKNLKLDTTNLKKEETLYNLFIIGNEYNFSTLDLIKLRRKFNQLTFIKSEDVETARIIEQLNHESKTVILFNTFSISNNLLTVLRDKEINHFEIQNFIEKYLLKCYIYKNETLIKNIKNYSLMNHAFKIFIDYVAIITLGVLASPFMLYSIYRIKKESPGPVLFRQNRIGLNGKEFECIKFRSMNLDAEKNGAQFATANDNRIFKWGKVMRSTRIDELPQLWNILKGDMHLIGPRPERKIWINQFEKKIPHYHERHNVKPGVTGWAQVLYPYGENAEDAKQKLMYDLYYIKHWSLWLEIKTIWKTIMVVLMRKGV
jgi:lipopolysaccharide/colanic/teichoic acid biosynthesis glycosyltransferase